MKWWNKPGFTLIELMIVVSLVALLAVLATANLSFLDRLIVRSEIEKLHTIARYLQRCAITENKTYHLTFDEHNNAYNYENHHETLSPHIAIGIIPEALGPPASADKPIRQSVTFQNKRITFYPTGIMSAGTVYLIDRTKQCMFALSNAVSQISYLRLYQYDGTWNQIG